MQDDSPFWRPLLRDHPALVLTAGYIFLIMVGVMYEAWLFLYFKVNVLYYAEAADFLLVPIREPLVMVVALAPIPFFYYLNRITEWLEREKGMGRKRKEKMIARYGEAGYWKLVRSVRILTVILWSIAATMHYARWVQDQIRGGARRTVQVATVTGTTVSGPVVGTTNRYVFVFDRAKETTLAIPSDNIAQITFQSKKKR